MIKHIPIKDLSLLENNPRKITKDQFEKLVKSLQDDPDFFDLRPCLVNHLPDSGKMVVYAGNQRVLAAKKLKWKNVPCIIENDIREEVMKQRVIKDNSHYGIFDWEEIGNSYDVEMLIDCGLTLQELHLDMKDIETDEKEEKPKKLKMCPHCGQEI